MTHSHSTSDFNRCVFTKISLLLPHIEHTRKHAWVHDSCWLLKHLTHILSLLSAPSGQSNLVKLPKKIQPAVQMKSRMYGNWGTPTLVHFTEEREGEGTASMKDTVFALPEFRTCWLQSTHYKLWKFMQINIWSWLRMTFGKRPQEPSQPCVYLQNQVCQNDKLSLHKYVSQQNVLQPS